MPKIMRFDCRADAAPGECPMVRDDQKGHYVLAEDFAKVRAALARLVGVDGEEALLQMQEALMAMPVPLEDKINTVEACKALVNSLS